MKRANTNKLQDQGDLQYMGDLSAAVLESSPRSGRALLWMIVLILVLAAVWANYAELEEITAGPGKVIPSNQIQVVQNLEGGIVSEILVNEGDIVQKGQVLLRIDDTRFSASYRESQIKRLSLEAKVKRLEAEASGKPIKMPEGDSKEHREAIAREMELYKSRQEEYRTKMQVLKQHVIQQEQEMAELKSTKAHLSRRYSLINRELQLTKPLMAEGAVSEVEILRLERDLVEVSGQIASTRANIEKTKSKYEEAKHESDEYTLNFRNEAREELNATIAELEGLRESNVALVDRVERTSVRSPVHGTVKQLLIYTVGGVISPGMNLVEIVPLEDTLLVEAQIRPSDIAFLRPGQQAVVKFTAYDFTVYGGLSAKLEHISADSITDEQGDNFYIIRVRTEKSHLGSEDAALPIIAGMTASVEILTGKKTVMHYLLKPLLRAKERALREK